MSPPRIGTSDTSIVATTVPPASTRLTVPSAWFITQTES